LARLPDTSRSTVRLNKIFYHKNKIWFLYRKMATPEVMSFHNANAISERERVRLRIQQGTKASSPDVRSYRRQHLDIYQPHATLADNSTGSKNRPFYATKDESHISLEDKVKMRGGVLSTPEGQKYAKFILNRRAKDITMQDLEAQGIEPSTVLPTDNDLVLTADESKSLELNTLLQSISDAVDARDFSGLTITDLKNIPRLMITTLPKMTQNRFAELVRFIEELIDELEAITEPKEDLDDDEDELKPDSKATAGADRIKNYLENILVLLREFAKVIGRDEASKTATLKALVNEFLGLRKSTSKSIIPPTGQFRVVDKRSRQPIASGEQRAQPIDVNKPVRRVIIPPPPRPRAPPPPPPAPAEEEREEEEDSTAPPPVRRLTAEQKAFEARMDEAYRLAKSKVAGRREAGLATLREGAIALGKKVPADATRTKLKNLIEKGTPYVLG
jgi:hypothetical protein